MKVPFVDLKAQHKEIGKELNSAIKKVIQRGDFIIGEDLKLFESEFAKYCKSRYGIGVNSGTDALFLGLLSLGIGRGDEVIVPAYTYIATALAVTFTGARPVFVDINEDTYNIDALKIEKAITKKTKAIIPVHLYGQAADMDRILEISKRYNLKVIEDAAQAHGAIYRFKSKDLGPRSYHVGSMGDIGCFSFYPTKNLGALGDGGMLITDNQAVYKRLLMLRDYGRKSRYEHVSLGYNSRLDTLQAAIVRVKLRHLNKWNEKRRKCARVYSNKLKHIDVVTPYEKDGRNHVYHAYVIRVKNRDKVVSELAKCGIGVLIHYPIPLPLQEVYKSLGYKNGDFPVAEKAAKEVLSLPIFPHLKETQIKYIVSKLKSILSNR